MDCQQLRLRRILWHVLGSKVTTGTGTSTTAVLVLWSECLPRSREVTCSIPGLAKPRALQLLLVVPIWLNTQHLKDEWLARCQNHVTNWSPYRCKNNKIIVKHRPTTNTNFKYRKVVDDINSSDSHYDMLITTMQW